ncbi:MAG: amino acid ABC transporter substrate-binding protein [Candidatus Melainabacteria bacterium]|nr:amino acid ABC transporter substrate-binding protein [Candidatus Melainabacteria bacterium]
MRKSFKENIKSAVAIPVVAICMLLAVTILASCNSTRQAGVSDQASSVYDRVIKSGQLRCAYVMYPPACIKDPNNGQLSGVFVEAVEALGKNLGLKVQWTEEVGWGSMIEGLETNRYDIIGSGVWPNSNRARVVGFSKPLFYSAIGAYVRPDDTRFSKDLASINSLTVKIATIDGETAEVIARNKFPKAQRISLPQLSDVSQMLLNVSQHKADVAFVEAYTAHQFLNANPKSVKNALLSEPVAIFGNCLMFKRGQSELKSMLDTALDELIDTGFIDKLLDKYEPEPGLFFRVARPYQLRPNQP